MTFAHNNPHLWVQYTFRPFWFCSVASNDLEKWCTHQTTFNTIHCKNYLQKIVLRLRLLFYFNGPKNTTIISNYFYSVFKQLFLILPNCMVPWGISYIHTNITSVPTSVKSNLLKKERKQGRKEGRKKEK